MYEIIEYGNNKSMHCILFFFCYICERKKDLSIFMEKSGGIAMKAKKNYRQILILLFLLSLCGIAVLSYYYINVSQIPDHVSVFQGREEVMSFLPKSWVLPVNGRILLQETEEEGKEETESKEESLSVSQYMGTKKLPSDLLHINLSDKVAIHAQKEGQYQMEIRCFGILMKKVNLQVLKEQNVIPSGNLVGIYGRTNGILVLGTGLVTDLHGKKKEPAYNIVRSGDYIIEVDNVKITKKEELLSRLEESDGSTMELTLRRDGKEITVTMKPIQTRDEGYRLGIWVRDDTQGIGTMTFSTEDGKFGALGHAITDIDTGEVMALSQAGLYEAEIASITKGKPGEPGEISGIIHLNDENKIASILQNTFQGIFGTLSSELSEKEKKQSIPVALRQEITAGAAKIYCQIDGKLEEYQVEIEKIDKNPDIESKGMVIHIVDEKLLEKTNGIIQGMSGSPIIQKGKFIGAVTHVFVNDSTRGYGIFAENMVFNLQN